MFRKLGLKVFIFILLIGEIMTVHAGILAGMNTEQIMSFVLAYSGIVLIFMVVSMNIDNIAKKLVR